jgi:hypothetical protein
LSEEYFRGRFSLAELMASDEQKKMRRKGEESENAESQVASKLVFNKT